MGLAVFLLAAPALAGAKLTGEWVSPDPVPPAARVLVCAAIDDAGERRTLEDAVARELQSRGFPALASHRHLAPGDLADEAALLAKAGELGVDGLISLRVVRTGTELKPGPAVGVSVGVPVRIGGLGVFLGGGLPLGGRGRAVAKAEIQAEFVHRSSREPRWASGIVVDLDAGTAGAAEDLARLLRKTLTKRKLLPKR